MPLGFGNDFHLGVVLEAKNLLRGEMRKVKADTDEAKAKIRGLQNQLQQLERYGRGMKIGAGITAAGVGLSMLSLKLVDANSQIEESVNTVGLAAGIGTKAWEAAEPRVRRSLERMSIEHGVATDAIAAAWYRGASAAGISEEAWNKAGDTILYANAAMKGTAADAEATTKAVGMFQKNFASGLTGKTQVDQLKETADMMTYLTTVSAQTAPALAEGLAPAMSTAKLWNMEGRRLLAIMGALSNANFDGAMAGTAFAATMRQMIDAEDKLGMQFKKNTDGTLDFDDAMAKLATRREQVGLDKFRKQMQETFGDEGMRAVMVMIDQRKEISAMDEALGKAAGTADRMGKALMASDPGKLAKFSQAWTVFKGSLMKDNVVVEHAVDLLTKLMGALNGLPDWARTIIGTGIAGGGALASVAGPAMTGFNALMLSRLSKGIVGGGLGGPTPVYETNPAALGAGGVAGAGGKGGIAGKAGLFGLAAVATVAQAWAIDKIGGKVTKAVTGGKWGEVGPFGAWAAFAKGTYTGVRDKGYWKGGLTGGVEGVGKKLTGNENFTINIGTVNTKAADGATLAKELKTQARRTGVKPSPP